MLGNALAAWLYSILSVLFSDWNPEFAIPYGPLMVFREILNVVTYFFPLGAIRNMIICVLGLQAYRIGVSIFKTIKALLPFV